MFWVFLGWNGLGATAFTALIITYEGVLSRLLLMTGAVILLLGIAGIAVPYFTTEQTKDVADVGPLHVHATEQKSHFIPPLLSDAAVAVGVVLMGVGLVGRR